MDSKAIPDLAQVRQAHRYSARRGAGGVPAVFRRGECGRPHAEVPREPDGARGDGAHIAQLPVPHGTASRAGTRHAPGGRQGGTRRLSTTSVCTELTVNCWAATSGALHGDDAGCVGVELGLPFRRRAEDVRPEVVAGDPGRRLDGQAVPGCNLQPACHPLGNQTRVDPKQLGQGRLSASGPHGIGDCLHAAKLRPTKHDSQ